MANTNDTIADTDGSKKRKYNTAFDEALVQHRNEPRVLELTKQEWVAEMGKNVIDIDLSELLITLVFIQKQAQEAIKFVEQQVDWLFSSSMDNEADILVLRAVDELRASASLCYKRSKLIL